ncbi:hypothetical protein NKH77_04235 [Streptomyces sp. M19]
MTESSQHRQELTERADITDQDGDSAASRTIQVTTLAARFGHRPAAGPDAERHPAVSRLAS